MNISNEAGTIAPEQFLTVNGQQISVEDATKLVTLGQKWQELEGKLNTSLDKVVPEYTRATQLNKDFEQKLAERDKMLEELQQKAQPKSEVPQDVEEALKAARGIGLVDNSYLKEQGYIRKDELDEYLASRDTNANLVKGVLDEADKLAKEIDGTDGRVPFNQKAVMAYAAAYDIADLKQAYDEMNEGLNKTWQEKQIQGAERPGLTTQGPGGVKQPEPVKVTEENFKALWDELYPKQ